MVVSVSRRHPSSTLFPYTTLFRSLLDPSLGEGVHRGTLTVEHARRALEHLGVEAGGLHHGALDRKSTRLNSSHLGISYAVFCLKKKKDHARDSICLKRFLGRADSV